MDIQDLQKVFTYQFIDNNSCGESPCKAKHILKVFQMIKRVRNQPRLQSDLGIFYKKNSQLLWS